MKGSKVTIDLKRGKKTRTFSLLPDFINKDNKGENFLQKIKNITKYDLTFYKNIITVLLRFIFEQLGFYVLYA